MSKSSGNKFSAGNQDEEDDFSSDESFSSRNNSQQYSRSNSENSSPRHKVSGSSSLSSFTTTTHVTASTEISSDEPEVREDINISNSDSSSSDTDCDIPLPPFSKSSWLSSSANKVSHQNQSGRSSQLYKRAVARVAERITKTTSGLIIRQPATLNHRSAHSIWSNLARRRSENRFIKKMYTFSVKYHKEICVILFLFASGFPFLRSKPLKTRSVQSPGPFFDQREYGDLVEDHYRGEYVDLVHNKVPRAPSFVFYYAPWDSESLAAKKAFLDVARHFRFTKGDQVKFYAVNCWWPDGQCRQNYKNLSHYPIFVAHLSGAAGVIYNGPIRAELMIRFLNLVLRPVTRIDSEDELWRFRAQHDAVMLAYFNFSIPESAAAYDIYLQMALRNLEADPLGQVGYGVFLRKNLGEKYFVTSSNAISLVLFNEIHTAKWHGGFSSQDAKAPIKQVADWVMERTKSTPLTWAYRVRSGFSNRPVTLGPLDLAQELTNGPVLLLITRRYYPSAYSPFYTQVKEVALDYFNCNKSGNVTRLRRYTHKINSEWLKLWKLIQKICNAAEKPSFNCELMREQLKNWKTSEVLLEREPISTFENVSSSLNFTGLSCRSSKPLRFLAIDPADVPHFIDLALGGVAPAATSLTSQEPLAFIIDAANNLVLPLPSFKTSEIAYAVQNYTAAVLTGGLQSDKMYRTRLWVEPPRSSKKLVNIEKLNAEQLLSIVNGNSGDGSARVPLFVMYMARFCGYCGVALAQLVSLANFLSEYNTNIRIARIDVFRNSLPAHMTVGEIPSFVYFPPHNRSDMRTFPSGEEISLKNLLKFVLSELDSKTRIELSLRSPLCSEVPDEDSVMELEYRSSRENTTKARKRLQEFMGPRHCQVINRKLVTKQIGSVLAALKAELLSGSPVNTFEISREPASNFLLGLNKYKHQYFNGDKLYFMEEFSTGSGSSDAELVADHQNTVSIKNGYQLTGKNPQRISHVGLIDFESDPGTLWSHQLLDHLRSMRLFLDVA